MKGSENIHAGHRERMISRLLKSPSSFSDHELLEVLLYFAVPRKDTNELAHRLLNAFGGLAGLVNATEDQLVTIAGVGKRIAADIIVVSQIAKRLYRECEQGKLYIRNEQDFLSVIEPSLQGKGHETFIMVMLDSDYAYLGKVLFSDTMQSNVSADIPEILTAITINKPTFVAIAHNHPSGVVEPSEQDDIATMQVCLLCEIHGVCLVEHVILGRNKNYSYRLDGRLQELTKTARLNDIFNKMKETKQ